MPTKARDPEITLLAEALLRELEILRRSGGDAYPPRLRHLAALTGGSPTEAQILKAAAKVVFTRAAVVTEKVQRKPSHDSPVYFKQDAPAKRSTRKPAPTKKPKEDSAGLANRMLLVLEAQRRLGAEAYPPTLRRLAELCDVNASDTRVTKAAGLEALTGAAIVAAKANRKPSLDAPVFMRQDLDGDAAAILPALLKFALAVVSAKGRAKESTAFTVTEVTGRLVPELKHAVSQALERGDLPENVAWVLVKGKPYFFLAENLRSGAARPFRRVPVDGPEAQNRIVARSPLPPVRPTQEFPGAFREAFEQLDRRNGGTNFVKLADLRRMLAGFGREEFDLGLRALRLEGEFSLDSHEGLHGSLTDDERDAGVREAGSLLIYVSRR
jgi:hypothetical protein